MSLDFVERFFKLTLDNVYRFVCSLLFAVAVVALSEDRSPIEQLAKLFDWLAIPSSWLMPIAEWVGNRQAFVGGATTLALVVAIGFTITADWRSRSGSTVLFSFVALAQVGQGAPVLGAAGTLLAGVALITGVTNVLAHRFQRSTPGWVGSAWEKIVNVFAALTLAALYLFSPFGWLISQESRDARGTQWNPLFIEQVERRDPQGAATSR